MFNKSWVKIWLWDSDKEKLTHCKNVNKRTTQAQECEGNYVAREARANEEAKPKARQYQTKGWIKQLSEAAFSQCIRITRIRRCLQDSANLLSQFF